MVTFSTFKHEWTKSNFLCNTPQVSPDYKVFVNEQEVPVYTCRISAYPFNRVWPGFQRPVAQTERASFVNLIADEEIKIEVEPLTKTAYKKVLLKPYSKNVKMQKEGGRVAFTLKESGGYVLELDDYHGCLYIFNNKPVPCKNKERVTYYFDKGVHFPGKIVLKSNESVYLEKDAYVYGCIFAENAENIHIYGNGIFDDSSEERFCGKADYEPYTNGNLKLYDCQNVKIVGVGFTNSAIWCINVFHCFDVDIDGINVFGQWRYNADGADLVNSQRITIKNSFIHSFDDSITVKGIDRYWETDCTDMLFENCVLWCDWGKACEIGLETMCCEYKNITFRNCDVIRGAAVACDIANGDCAEVHDIIFENIRLELESFYTAEVYQHTDEQVYTAQDQVKISEFLNIKNRRFRDQAIYQGFVKEMQLGLSKDDKNYASVHDIMVKDITIYADEKIISMCGDKCARMAISNYVDTAYFANVYVENVVLNGKNLTKDEMGIALNGVEDTILIVK